MTQRIAFVDTSLPDYQSLIAALDPGIELVLITPGQDGWEQVAAALKGRTDIAALDIFSHGAPASVQLGSGVLTANTLPAHAATLAEIGSHLAADADILLYGCAVGAGSAGQEFLNQLAAASGADVAASIDITGAAALGGNWILEATAGTVATAALQAPAYPGSLATITGTDNADVLNGSVVDDVITGLAGDDTLNGFGGNDLLDGGTGSDRLFGGQGNDTLLAGNDFDVNRLFGEDGDDTLTGSSGPDTLDGGNGNDTLDAGSGSDFASGGDGNDTLDGGSGNDSLNGERGNDVLRGGDGNDSLSDFDFSGTVASNTLDAGAGDDAIDVYQSNAGSITTVTGGSGRDTYRLQPDSVGVLLATDFAPGASGDILNINTLLTNSSGYSGGNPFAPALGYLRLVQQGADTLLQWDRDGAGAAINTWQTVITLQNTSAAALTSENFAPSTGITNIEVVVINTAPVVSAALADQPAAEDANFNFVVPAGAFTDPDAGDTLSYSATLANGAALPAWLSFDAATRSFSGTPAQVDVGTSDVRVTATDAAGLSANDVFTLTVSNVNDAPVTTAVTLTAIAEDSGARTITQAELLANASDPDGDSLSASGLTIASGAGSLTDNLNGTWSYTPALNDDSAVSFSYSVSDGSLSAAGSASLDLTPVNDVPTAAADTLAATEDTPTTFTAAELLGNDSDPDNATLVIGSVTSGSGGTAMLNANGTVGFTPTANFNGTASFSYTASDGTLSSASAAVTVNVSAVNDAPTVSTPLQDRSFTSGAAFAFTIPAATFSDADNDTLTYSATLAGGAALPGWLQFNAATGAFSGNPTVLDVGSVNVELTATDPGGLAVSDVFALAIAAAAGNIVGTANADVLTGTNGIESIYGLAGDDQLNGLGGNDQLFGGDGQDRLNGGDGNDTMTGGLGDDTYVVNAAGDIVVENADSGRDRVEASINYTLGLNLEDLVLTGNANLNGTGNGLNNVLTGNNGRNTLSGLGGNDTLIGGLGNDTLTGGAGFDKFVFSTDLRRNVDAITDFASGTNTIWLSNTSGSPFAALPGGVLAAGAFDILGDATAPSADTRVVYDTRKGTLSFDADGVGGAAAVQFATLVGQPLLAHTDIHIGA